jgi:excisionase family DNA binding protein
MEELTVTVVVPAELVAAIAAQAVAQIEAQATPVSPFLTVFEAAEFLRAKPQRVYDLLSARRLTRHKEGSRTLILRSELERYVREER